MPGKDGEDDLADFKKALEDYRKDVVEFLQQEDITVEGAGTGIGQVGGPDSASTSSLPVKPSQDLETFRKALESYRVGVEQLRKTGKIEAIDYPVLLGEYFEGIRSYKETMKDIQQVVGGNAP
jgi:hypothetical protein